MATLLSKQLKNTQDELQSELTLATQKVLEKFKGMEGSDLIKSIEWEYNQKQGAFEMLALDYYTYVSTGRKPRARKVPIEDLLSWIKRKRISTLGGSPTATAWKIQRAIYKNGIRGKKYEDPVIDVTTELTSETISEDLSNYIVDDIVLILEQNN